MASIKVPNARKEVAVAYDRMAAAWDNYQTIGGENFKCYYEARLNDYRDLCTIIVERLMHSNPKVLEDMTICG
jgi:hypothetical protein